MSGRNYDDDLVFATQMAQAAGDIVDKYWDEEVAMEIKPDGTPVSVVDTEINDIVITMVEESYPHHRIIGEEKSGGKEDSEQAWVVDPFDGSQTFEWRTRGGTFSAALVEAGVPKVAVIYEFGERVMYYATKGKGAFIERDTQFSILHKQLRVSDTENWRDTKGTINAYKAFTDHNPYLLNREILSDGKGARILDYGGFCFNSMLVAQGHWGFDIAGFQSEYDAAAVALIVPEAGGRVTDLAGSEQLYDRPINGAVVTNGHIHDDLLEILYGVTV